MWRGWSWSSSMLSLKCPPFFPLLMQLLLVISEEDILLIWGWVVGESFTFKQSHLILKPFETSKNLINLWLNTEELGQGTGSHVHCCSCYPPPLARPHLPHLTHLHWTCMLWLCSVTNHPGDAATCSNCLGACQQMLYWTQYRCVGSVPPGAAFDGTGRGRRRMYGCSKTPAVPFWRLPLAACSFLPSGHTPWLLGHDLTGCLVQQLLGELDMCGSTVPSFPLACRWYDCLIFNLVVTFHHGIFHSVLAVVYCNDLWTKNESVRTFLY